MATWEQLADLPLARSDLSAATDGSGRVYAIAGAWVTGSTGQTARVDRYDPGTGLWSNIAVLPNAAISGAASTDSSGRVYFLGGRTSSAVLTAVWRYDSGTNSWSQVATMPEGRYQLDATFDTSDRLYVGGGNLQTGGILASTRRWNLATGTWDDIGGFTSWPGSAVVRDAQGRIYAIGGSNGSGALATVTRYNPATGAIDTPASLPVARTGIRAATDAYGRVYVFGGNRIDRYDPSTNSWAQQADLTEPRTNLAVTRDSDGRIYIVGGFTTTYSARVDRLTVNAAPNAPVVTAPPNSTAIDLAAVQRFDWNFSDPDPGDSQSKYDLRYRLVGSGTWTDVTGTSPNSFHDFAAGTFTAGDYEWQVRTYDAQGAVGPYCGSAFFTAATAPSDLTITGPANGATIGSGTETVTWSTPTQQAYQVRRVADDAGAPDTATIYYDSGEVPSTLARSLGLTFSTNNRYEHIQVRIKAGGLWSEWASIRVQVSYTPPETPMVELAVDADTGSLLVTIANPTPGAGVPAVTHNDVYIDDGDGEERKATELATNATWRYWTPVSGRDYATAIRVVAVGDNGTTSSSS